MIVEQKNRACNYRFPLWESRSRVHEYRLARGLRRGLLFFFFIPSIALHPRKIGREWRRQPSIVPLYRVLFLGVAIFPPGSPLVDTLYPSFPFSGSREFTLLNLLTLSVSFSLFFCYLIPSQSRAHTNEPVARRSVN